MKIKIGNEEYVVQWRHNNNIGILGEKNKPIKSSTECFITITGGGVVSGRAILHDEDKNYDRKKGKKSSFERAVSCISDRNIRTKLWEMYWNSYKQPVIILEVDEVQLSMLNTLADVSGSGDERIYTVNRNKFKIKLRENATNIS